MIKKGSAAWKGSLKEGTGSISTETGVLKNAPYGFKARFEDGPGTNPEELIAAAHAGCFSMALSAFLGKAGHKPERVATQANLTLDQVQGNWTITAIELSTTAKVPGIDRKEFDTIANDAKANCPVSRVLNAKITLTTKLED